MKTHVLHRQHRLDGTPEEVFPFFADAFNLERITPPLLGFNVITPGPIEMHVGTLIEYRLKVHRIPISWLTSIQAWDPPYAFVDMQLRGPYALWHHTHTFEPTGDGGTLMTDLVRWGIGFGGIGELAARAFVRRDVEAIFAYRAEVVDAMVAKDIQERAAA